LESDPASERWLISLPSTITIVKMLRALTPFGSTTLAGLFAFAIFPACAGRAAQPTLLPDGGSTCPATSSPSMPRALIGPDVDVRVLCGGTVNAPIASIDEPGAGVTRWSFTVKGDPAFSPGMAPIGRRMALSQPMSMNTFVTCEATSPQVAFVEFNPPLDAVPGSTFDAIATVHADDGSFADGMVKLRGDVIAPALTVDKTSVDFGDVAPGAMPVIPIHFAGENGALEPFLDPPPVATGMSEGVAYYSYGPFVFTPTKIQCSGCFTLNLLVWDVTFMSDVPGDYSTTVGWRAPPPPRLSTCAEAGPCLPLPPKCDWTTTMTLHARVVADAGADTADTSDGSADPAPDAP
jgi:hypothetical protein